MIPEPQVLSSAEALAAARETRALEIGHGILRRVPEIFRQQFGDRPAIIVSDPNTFAAAGHVVQEAFAAAGHVILEPFLFPDPALYAEYRFVDELRAALEKHDAVPVSVGAGSINDLTKLASHQTGRRYLCVGTAASMDGYTAYGSSITHQGSKQTFDCPAPVAVVADLDVIAAAPAAMNAWGYADLLAKVTAGADWIVADFLEVEPIDPLTWNIVQGGLRKAVGDPDGIRGADPEAIALLVEGLMLGGFAMQASRSSRPASGAEHQFSHLWDMQHHTHEGWAPSHGLKVGIGTVAVTALYEQLLNLPLESLDVEACCAAWPDLETLLVRARAAFDQDDLIAVAERELTAKHSSRGGLRVQLETLRRVWPKLRGALRKQLIPLTELKAMLTAAGAAVEPEQISISRPRLRESYLRAFYLRRRFTVLDLAVRAGLLESCLDQIFGPDGIWPCAAAPSL
ncbi:MAG: sn-glycerol-1-phosphate dehydrogenase [Verrucomicrobiota bacterium]